VASSFSKETGFMEDKWEMFYTHTAGGKRDDYSYVDMLSINMTNKRYILDVHTDIRNTDGENEDGTCDECYYISRGIFDILLDGLKQRGFKEFKEAPKK
jgi:hypothetical protein